MRVRFLVLLLAVVGLLVPDAASADFVHVVGPGESLSSVAAADGLSVAQLAAANGLAPDSQITVGTGLQIPPQPSSGAAATATTTTVTTTTSGDGDGDSDDPVVAAAPAGDGDHDADDMPESSTAAASGAGHGSYVVQPGDTLSAIAARAGISAAQLAAANGLDLNRALLAGAVLRLGAGPAPSGSSVAGSAASQPVGTAAEGTAVSPPYPTAQTVSPSTVGTIAAANGVPPSLADAIAYQESGFDNGAVSSADARGVMQILPGTWDWIQHTLVAGASPLAPASATDNVRGGVLLLRSLLNSTGGDPALAAAGYYQGLPSVRRYGMYPSTEQYVNNVMALAHRFGGG